MCGIVGIHGPRAEGADLSASLEALSLRGPDRQAFILTGKACLGHARLSIIDTSAASDQPMQDPSGRYSIVFNGEIYNYRTIREELEAEGLVFQSSGDTEVLLHLLIKEGVEGLKRLNGFFAFAFYDAQKDELLLVRDRLGIKPLYYSDSEGSISFGSEMKALSPLLGSSDIDPIGVDLFFQLNYIPAPHTANLSVKQLLPGHYLRHSKGITTIERYFQIARPSSKRISDIHTTLYSLMETSVERRMVSDVPLGSFLSGGVDSSIIAALAVKQKKNLKTFSIGFRDQGYFDESQYAEQVADHIGSDHRTLHIHEEELLHSLDAVLDYIDEPFADSSAIAVHALCHFARQEVTVALSGDGADELFGGYNKHQAHLRAFNTPWSDSLFRMSRPIWSLIPSSHSSRLGNASRQLGRYLDVAKLPAQERFWAWSRWTDAKTLQQLLSPEVFGQANEAKQAYLPQEASMEAMLRGETQLVLPNDMLVKVDRMSMANSLEVRVPFLDHEVVNFAHSLRASERLRPGQGKFILKASFADLLPAEIFERKKKGFEVPLEHWFKGPLYQRMHSVLSDGRLASSGLFQVGYLNALDEALSKGQIAGQVHLLWALMVFHSFLSKQSS
ncbi:MAG: asparagine synthase (glutamine-hydrolyzing) [Bacteroidetes bacterium]|nr:asparagine synthase (glutamine-hydrolyzing) [Bacteroidota bacterium]